MKNKYYHIHHYHDDGDIYDEYEYVGFDRLLTEEQEKFLTSRTRKIYEDEDYECSGLREAIAYTLEKFEEKFGFTGDLDANPFVKYLEV